MFWSCYLLFYIVFLCLFKAVVEDHKSDSQPVSGDSKSQHEETEETPLITSDLQVSENLEKAEMDTATKTSGKPDNITGEPQSKYKKQFNSCGI